jgi:aquaporin-4
MAVVPGSIQDVKTRRFWVALLAEFIGTMFLVLVACGACARFPAKGPRATAELVTPPTTTAGTGARITTAALSRAERAQLIVHYEHPTDIVQISLAFGLSVATIVWAIAHISGGHINPAVTFGFLVTRKISVLRALLYVACQCLGALIGAGILKLVSPSEAQKSLGHSAPDDLMKIEHTLLVELLITFVLVWTVFATCDSQRTDMAGSGPLAIGLAIAMCHFWAVPYTGSGMNPARVFGVAIVSDNFDITVHWAYWVGPLIGAALAALMYDFVFAVNATGAKVRGFFSLGYDDSQFDRHGRKPTTSGTDGDLPLRGRA